MSDNNEGLGCGGTVIGVLIFILIIAAITVSVDPDDVPTEEIMVIASVLTAIGIIAGAFKKK